MHQPGLNRRRFLQASVAASLAGSLGDQSSRGGDLGVDAGPFATANGTIRQARQVALSILKPDAKDLVHGLETHADALVFESYGFAPRCAIDGDAMREAIEADASDG